MPHWEEVVERHGPAAYVAAWRILGHRQDAEDAMQAALLDAWKLHQRDAVRNWSGLLRQLSVRRALDVLRRRKKTEEFSDNLPSPTPAPTLAIESQELVARLRMNLGKLPTREAEVFGLHFFADLTCAEIAAVLHTSPGAVATALHKAKRKLRSHFLDLVKEKGQ